VIFLSGSLLVVWTGAGCIYGTDNVQGIWTEWNVFGNFKQVGMRDLSTFQRNGNRVLRVSGHLFKTRGSVLHFLSA